MPQLNAQIAPELLWVCLMSAMKAHSSPSVLYPCIWQVNVLMSAPVTKYLRRIIDFWAFLSRCGEKGDFWDSTISWGVCPLSDV